jgi:uncharacterized protein (TIGR03437 family)
MTPFARRAFFSVTFVTGMTLVCLALFAGKLPAFFSSRSSAQSDAAREFHLAKRTPEKSTSLTEQYREARRRMCQMPRYATARDQQLPSLAQANGETSPASDWIELGPAPSQARGSAGETNDPCAGTQRSAPPEFEFGATLFTQGLALPGGNAWFGATLDRGLLQGNAAGWRTILAEAKGSIAVDPNDSSVLYAAGPGLAMRKSTDGGQSFRDAANGISDEGLLVAPLAVDANDGQRLWTGGRRLWRTNDGAGAWTQASAPIPGSADARVSAIAVAAANSGYVVAGTSEGHLLRTHNGFNTTGNTEWAAARPRAGFVSSVAFDPHNPNIVYATYSTFGGAHVWRSLDAGASWASIDAALPDAPAHSLVVDHSGPAPRLYLGTDLGVFVSPDGGENWLAEATPFGAAIVESLAIGNADGAPALFAFTHGRRAYRTALAAAQCNYTIAPANAQFNEAGGTGSVAVTTTSACNWTATVPAAATWITITSGATGTGNGTVNFTVAANPGAAARTATLTIAGNSFRVDQAGVGGTCQIIPIRSGQTLSGALSAGDCFSRQRTSSFGDRYSFAARAGELVAITLNATFDNYLYLVGPNGAVVTSSSNFNSPSRIPQGTGFFELTAAGEYIIEVTTFGSGTTGPYTLNLSIVPAGCGFYTLLPAAQSFDAAGGNGSLQVATGSNCPWTASTADNWITIASGASSAGSLPLNFTVAANTGAYRRGTITVAGQNFSVEQAGAGGSCLPVAINSGQTVNGALSAADCRSRRGVNFGGTYYADRYSFTATAGQQAVVSTTGALATYLYLINAGGTLLLEGETRVPIGRGSFAVPADGTYFIELTSANNAGTGNYSLSLNLLPPGCGYAAAPLSHVFESAGGAGSVAVTTSAGCAWTATSNAGWITIDGGASGAGAGALNFSVAANSANAFRRGTLTVAGQTITVDQAGAAGSCLAREIASGQTLTGLLNEGDCRSRHRSPSFQGGVLLADRFSFAGAAGQQVLLSAVANGFAPYLYLTSASGLVLAEGRDRAPAAPAIFVLPASGTYFVELTTESTSNSGSYSLSLSLTQGGCNFTVTPAAQGLDAVAGVGAINVMAAQGCNWMAVSNAGWLTFPGGGSGSGNGTLNFAVAANNSTVLRRANVDVAGQTVIVEQAGAGGNCSPVPIAAGQTVSGSLTSADCQSRIVTGFPGQVFLADRYGFNATAGEQATITFTSNVLFPTVYLLDAAGAVLASSDTGRLPASGLFSIPATGAYIIEINSRFLNAGNSYTLTLDTTPANCAYAIAPARQTFEASGGTGSFNVATSGNCPWTAVANASWVTINSGASGAGDGAVTFTVAANATNSLRTAAINAAGRVFTIEQAGAGGSCATQEVKIGDTVNGTLSNADCRSRLRTQTVFYTDRYALNFTAGQQLAIAASSPNFSPYLYLTDQNGVVIREGSSRLPIGTGFLTLPATGVYFIEITPPVQFSATSTYTLRLTAPTECAFSLLPPRQTFETGGGAGSINVVTAANCAWTATSNANWLAINSGASGTGNGAINFTAAANTTGSLRAGTITVGNQSYIVEQAASGGSCAARPIAPGVVVNASLSPADCPAQVPLFSGSSATYADRYSFTAAAGDRLAVSVASPSTSTFDQLLSLIDPRGAVIQQSSVTLPFVTAPLGGTYTIEYAATRNWDYTVTLFQNPAGCAYAIAPGGQAFEFAGGEGSFDIAASAGCAWTVVNTANWITLANSSGAGNGTVRFTVATNNSLNARRATLLVGGQSFLVEQAGVGGSCAVVPLVVGQLASGTLTEADCLSRGFTDQRRADRYSFTGAPGDQIALQALTGTFTPALIVHAPNGSQLARVEGLRLPAGGFLMLPAAGVYQVEIVLGGFFGGDNRAYQLNLARAGGGCAYALNSSQQGFEATGGAGSVGVISAPGCAWGAVSTANWVTIDSGANGAGNGAVNFTVAPNPGINTRSARLLIAGQSFTIDQAGAGGNCTPAPITPGTTVAGVLNQSDCPGPRRINNEPFADRYSFTAQAGQQVSIAVNPRVDLHLLDQSGAVLAVGGTVNFVSDTRIPVGSGFLPLPAAGTYVIEVAAVNTTNYTLTLLVTQGACTYGVSPASRAFDPGGQTGSFNVVTGASCVWTAASDASWITINSGASGTGNGAVGFTLAANAQSQPRTGVIRAGGETFSVTQAGAGGNCAAAPIVPGQAVNGSISAADCATIARTTGARADRYTFNGMAGQRVSIAVTTQVSQPALALLDPAGALLALADATRLPRGGGVIVLPATGAYTVEFSAGSTGNYALTLSLADACVYAVSPTMLTVESGGGIGSVMVTAAAGCDWSVASNARAWLLPATEGGFGSGNGAARFQIAANPDPTPRTGTLVVAGQTVTVRQLGLATVTSAASFRTGELAAESIAVGFGVDLATAAAAATTSPLPTTLAGTTVKVRDSAGATRDAGLFAVLPAQVNFLVPAGTAAGDATVIITSASGNVTTGTARIVAVAPGVFAANADGRGAAAGVVLRVRDGVQSFEPLVRLDPMSNRFVAAPIDLGPAGDEVFVILFGTGIRGRSDLAGVIAAFSNVTVAPTFAGAQGALAGLDQINLPLPRSLAGRGEVNVTLTVDGKAANVLQVNVR